MGDQLLMRALFDDPPLGHHEDPVVAHRLSQAKVADRILVMADGAVVEQGTHDELVARGGDYARLWEAWAG